MIEVGWKVVDHQHEPVHIGVDELMVLTTMSNGGIANMEIHWVRKAHSRLIELGFVSNGLTATGVDLVEYLRQEGLI